MRKSVLAFAYIAVTLPLTAQAQSGPLYRDVQQIQMVDDVFAVVTTARGNYLIRFRSQCQVNERGEFFVLDRFQLGQTVSAGDVFESSGTATPCTIESVTPMRDLVYRDPVD